MADAVRPDHHQVVVAAARSGQLLVVILVLGDDAPSFAEAHVAAHLVAPVVARGDVRIEADEARQVALTRVHLAHDLLVVDAFQQLARQRHAGIPAAAVDLVEEGIGDELQPLLDQLVVDLALALYLGLGLKLGGKPGLELAEADVVQARGIDVVAGDVSVGARSEFDGAIHRPVRPGRVVHRHEDLTVHGCLDWRFSKDEALVVQPCDAGAAGAGRPVRGGPAGWKRSTWFGKSGRAKSPKAVAERSAYIT